MDNTETFDSKDSFWMQIIMDACSNPSVVAAAARGREAFDVALLEALPALVQGRFERNAAMAGEYLNDREFRATVQHRMLHGWPA